MVFSNKRLLIPASKSLLAFLLLGCGQQASQQTIQRVSSLSSASGDFDPRIGEAYNRLTDKYLGSTCVSFDNKIGSGVEFIPPKVGDLVIQQDASFDDLSKALTGGGELSLNLDSFKGSGSVQFANEMQSDSYSTTVAVYYNIEQGEVALKQQEGLVTLNSLGTKAKGLTDVNQREKCGTEFVGRKKLAANFVAVLKFEFANKGQRDSFKGSANIDVGSFSGSADFSKLVAAASSDAKVTLKVRQIGGDATKLATLAVEDITKCSTKSRDKCDLAVASLFTYLKTFPNQFKDDAGNALPERYMTVANDYRSYASADAEWGTDPISPEKVVELGLNRRAFGEKMNDELGNYNRASSLVESGMSLTPKELEEIRAIQDVIRSRIKVYSDAAQVCYSSNWETCEDAYNQAALDIQDPIHAYDVTKLVIIPSDMLGWCAKLNQWGNVRKNAAGDAVANTILNFNEVFTLSKIFEVLQPNNGGLQLEPTATTGVNIVGSIKCASVVLATRDPKADKVSFAQMRLDNIDPLASLEYTRTLDLSQNFITDGLPLAKIRFLEVLNLAKNKVSSLEGMASTYLTTLNLSENSLTTPANGLGTGDKVLRQLSGISTLEKLDLSGNKFLTNLRALENLPALLDVNLSGTGLNRDEVSKFLDRRSVQFPSLQTVTLTSSAKLKCADVIVKYPFVICQ